MIRAVLFDLDDTLLRLNLTPFILSYVAGASKLLASVTDLSTLQIGAAFAKSLIALEDQARDDRLTNREFLNQAFFSHTQIALDAPNIQEIMDTYEREYVPQMSGFPVCARPQKGAEQAIEAAQNLGLTVALATNPTFSLATDAARLGWAGLDPSDFAYISTLDNSFRCKPHASYYQDFCKNIGVLPRECLMVGNDALRDFPQSNTLMKTAYVGKKFINQPKHAWWRGSMQDFAEQLPTLIDRLNSELD